MIKTDFIVIGSGIAGLTFALKVAKKMPEATVTIITKSDESESNTKYAQGGIAVALNNGFDSAEQHIADTLKAGDGLCNRKVVKRVVEDGAKRLEEVIEWGVRFDKKSSGKFDLGMEGGHSASRIVHHKDITGFELERVLLSRIHKTKNIEVIPHCYAIDLITEHHIKQKHLRNINCFGVYVLNKNINKIEKILARITLVATGGAGQVYRNTTNPLIATGDGISMASRAGAKISNMEFMQFHPTALYNPGESPLFLISEAVRGFGAVLRTKQGKRFMPDYDKRAELASRDIVARGIDYEMKKSGDDFVYLDCRHLDGNKLKKQFPNIFNKCRKIGINLKREMIPVVPAVHYLCGGIKTDIHGKTTINRLYACGECADTGLHGANRLASNSLLEALVFAHQCFEDAVRNVKYFSINTLLPGWNSKGTHHPEENVLVTHTRAELQMLMSDYVGIVRSNLRLQWAKRRIEALEMETKYLYDNSILSPQLCELRNMIEVAKLIVIHSINRKDNKGVFFKVI